MRHRHRYYIHMIVFMPRKICPLSTNQDTALPTRNRVDPAASNTWTDIYCLNVCEDYIWIHIYLTSRYLAIPPGSTRSGPSGIAGVTAGCRTRTPNSGLTLNSLVEEMLLLHIFPHITHLSIGPRPPLRKWRASAMPTLPFLSCTRWSSSPYRLYTCIIKRPADLSLEKREKNKEKTLRKGERASGGDWIERILKRGIVVSVSSDQWKDNYAHALTIWYRIYIKTYTSPRHSSSNISLLVKS